MYRMIVPLAVKAAHKLFHDTVVGPIQEKLVFVLESTWTSVSEWLVGLCGLIPEIGGIISDVAVVPIQLISDKVIPKLTEIIQSGFWKEKTTEVLDYATNFIGDALDRMEDQANKDKPSTPEEQTQAVKARIQEVIGLIPEKLRKIAKVGISMLEMLFDTLLPGVRETLKECNDVMKDIFTIIGIGQGKGFCEGVDTSFAGPAIEDFSKCFQTAMSASNGNNAENLDAVEEVIPCIFNNVVNTHGLNAMNQVLQCNLMWQENAIMTQKDDPESFLGKMNGKPIKLDVPRPLCGVG